MLSFHVIGARLIFPWFEDSRGRAPPCSTTALRVGAASAFLALRRRARDGNKRSFRAGGRCPLDGARAYVTAPKRSLLSKASPRSSARVPLQRQQAKTAAMRPITIQGETDARDQGRRQVRRTVHGLPEPCTSRDKRRHATPRPCGRVLMSGAAPRLLGRIETNVLGPAFRTPAPLEAAGTAARSNGPGYRAGPRPGQLTLRAMGLVANCGRFVTWNGFGVGEEAWGAPVARIAR